MEIYFFSKQVFLYCLHWCIVLGTDNGRQNSSLLKLWDFKYISHAILFKVNSCKKKQKPFLCSADMYAWLVVFVLPLNSAVNPFLYTFTTPKYRTKIVQRNWNIFLSRKDEQSNKTIGSRDWNAAVVLMRRNSLPHTINYMWNLFKITIKYYIYVSNETNWKLIIIFYIL